MLTYTAGPSRDKEWCKVNATRVDDNWWMNEWMNDAVQFGLTYDFDPQAKYRATGPQNEANVWYHMTDGTNNEDTLLNRFKY